MKLSNFLFSSCSELVIQNPRPYNLITFFSVRNGCDDCNLVLSEMRGTAYSYNAAEDTLKVPTFFGIVYHAKATRSIFEQHNFVTVPYLACTEMVIKRDDGDFYKMEDIWRIKKDAAYEVQ